MDFFFLSMSLRMLLTAFFVLAMGAIIAKARPSFAAIAIAMPVVIGPGFLILALEQDPDFILRAAEDSLGALAGTVAFAVAVALLAERVRAQFVLMLALVIWLCVVLMTGPAQGLLGNLAAFALIYLPGVWILRARPVAQRRPVTWSPRLELPRAVSAGLLVGVVTLSADYLGPTFSGTLIALPVGMLFVASGVLRSSDPRRVRDVLSAGARGTAALAVFLICVWWLIQGAVAPVTAVLAAIVPAVAFAILLAFAMRKGAIAQAQ